MKEIIDKLKKIRNEIEKMDDPTASEEYRNKINHAYDAVDECIYEIDES